MSKQQGQSLVEFALVLMFIILPVTFVLIDGALMLFTLSNVTNAAREGAHAGSIYQGTALQGSTQTFADYWAQIDGERSEYIKKEIRARLGPLMSLDECLSYMTSYGINLIEYGPPTPDTGNPFRELDSITVKLSCPRRLLFGLVNASQVVLTSEATMKMEPGGACDSTSSTSWCFSP